MAGAVAITLTDGEGFYVLAWCYHFAFDDVQRSSAK
jgi:hypothetical protein